MMEFLRKLFAAKDEHNPYYPMVPDDLYDKYEGIGGNINITGAAFEEMAGVRDEFGEILDAEVIARAHEISYTPGFSANYAEALRRAKLEIHGVCSDSGLTTRAIETSDHLGFRTNYEEAVRRAEWEKVHGEKYGG